MYLFAKQTKKAPERSKGICLDSVGQSNKPHFWIELDRASSACKGHLIYSLRLTGMDLSPPNTTTGGRPFLRLFTRKVMLGSRNRKRDWPGVILNERGHGGSRDRLRTLCSLWTAIQRTLSLVESWLKPFLFPLQRQISVRQSILLLSLGFEKRSGTQQYWYACDLRRHSWLSGHFGHADLQSNLAFDLVTRRDFAP